jgi:hypothetical protein
MKDGLAGTLSVVFASAIFNVQDTSSRLEDQQQTGQFLRPTIEQSLSLLNDQSNVTAFRVGLGLDLRVA